MLSMSLGQNQIVQLCMEQVQKCNACKRVIGNHGCRFPLEKFSGSLRARLGFLIQMGICPACGSYVSSRETPDWIVKRVIAIWEGRMEADGTMIERCPPAAAAGALGPWDFR